MSALTPALEVLFEDIRDLLQEASKHRGEVDPLYVRDKVAELQVEVEEVLKKAGRCEICEGPVPPLCFACYLSEMADLEAHREEVQRAHAATNGTL